MFHELSANEAKIVAYFTDEWDFYFYFFIFLHFIYLFCHNYFDGYYGHFCKL